MSQEERLEVLEGVAQRVGLELSRSGEPGAVPPPGRLLELAKCSALRTWLRETNPNRPGVFGPHAVRVQLARQAIRLAKEMVGEEGVVPYFAMFLFVQRRAEQGVREQAARRALEGLGWFSEDIEKVLDLVRVRE